MADFRALHHGPAPLRLVNAWDALSARVFALAGAPAIGTSSFAVAFARGHADGQQLPWDEVVAAVAAMVAAAGEVPVSADIEAGQGADPAAVASAVADVVAAGAVGINLEDKVHDEPGALFDVGLQCERIAAARSVGAELFVNARCDAFFGGGLDLDGAIDRGTRYVEAGADGLFLPGLVDLDALGTVAAAVPVPLNVMLWPGLPAIADLAAAGVRRVSQGASAFLATAGFLERSTAAYLGGEPADFAGDVPPAFHLLGGLAHR